MAYVKSCDPKELAIECKLEVGEQVLGGRGEVDPSRGQVSDPNGSDDTPIDPARPGL